MSDGMHYTIFAVNFFLMGFIIGSYLWERLVVKYKKLTDELMALLAQREVELFRLRKAVDEHSCTKVIMDELDKIPPIGEGIKH